MFHQSTNTLNIEAGTVINTGFTTFLLKTGSSNETATVSVDGTTLTPGNGVLIQVMDNDDATTGGMMSTDDAENTNGGSMNFKSSHNEAAGFNTDAAADGGTTQDFTFTNGTYTGNIYNASGSDGSTATGALDGSTLNVTLGSGATLTGAAAKTAAIHVTYDGSEYVKNTLHGDAVEDVNDATLLDFQNTSFGISEYYSIGQVANAINDNGGNDINISLTDDAVWYVDGTSVIDTLTISDNAKVVISEGVTLTANGETYSAENGEITLDAETINAVGTAKTSTKSASNTKADDYDETAFGNEGGSGSGTAASYSEVLGSWSSGGDEDYTWNTALFISGKTSSSTEETTKADNTITVKTTKKTIKYSKLKKKNQTFTIKASANDSAKLTFKKVSGKKMTVAKTGKVTVKKGLKKGTYKLKVKIVSQATSNYNKASLTKTIKVVVK